MGKFNRLYPTDVADDFRLAPSATGDGGDPIDGFRPLYSFCSEDGTKTDHQGAKDSAALLEEVRRQAHFRGVNDGREEAARMARASIVPAMQTFVDKSQGLALENQAAQSQTGPGALALALAVAERILGAAAGVTVEALGDLQPVVAEALLRANQVGLAMHPDDLERLRELMREEGLPWPDPSHMRLIGDETLDKGQLAVGEPVERPGIIDASVSEHLTTILGFLPASS